EDRRDLFPANAGLLGEFLVDRRLGHSLALACFHLAHGFPLARSIETGKRTTIEAKIRELPLACQSKMPGIPAFFANISQIHRDFSGKLMFDAAALHAAA